MSLLNRTKSYFFLVCVLMCAFLSLLTWHLLYGTYNITIFKGSKVNEWKRTKEKVRLATKMAVMNNQINNLAVDKLIGKVLPMFDNKNIKEMIMRRQFLTKSGEYLQTIRTSKSDLSFKSINHSASSVISINNDNGWTNQNVNGINNVNDLTNQKENGINSVNGLTNQKVNSISNFNDLTNQKGNSINSVNDLTNQKGNSINNFNGLTNQKVIRINNVNEKDGLSVNASNSVFKNNSENQRWHQSHIPRERKMASNTNVLENVWNLYKERSDKLNVKLKNRHDSNENQRTGSHKEHFSIPVSNHTRADRNTSYTVQDMLPSNQRTTSAVDKDDRLSSNHSDTYVDNAKMLSHNHGDTYVDNAKMVSHNHGDTYGGKEENPPSNHGYISQVNRENGLSNYHGNISYTTKAEMMQNDSPSSINVKHKKVVSQEKENTEVNKTSLNQTNRSEAISPYEHSIITMSKLELLKKKHPWLVLSNFDQLDEKVTFRPEDCQNCFKGDFPVIINQETRCRTWNSGKVDLLIFIFSAPLNFIVRDVIRNTWGKVCHDPLQSTTCLFVIGLSRNTTTNRQIQIENALYSDILQIGFKDSYSNLTYKTISSLKWANSNCNGVKHVMKTDDDMYVNTELIPLMLEAAPTKHFFGGHCWGPSRPNRDSFSKWYVSLTSFRRDKFPPMCSGTGYVMSMDVATSIVLTSRNIPFFHLEDVYVAMCLQKLDIFPANIVGFSNMFQEFDACRYRNEVMTSHQISSQYLKSYWQDIQQCPPSNISPQQLFIALPFSDIE